MQTLTLVIRLIIRSTGTQNMEYKFVELMSLEYTRSAEDTVQHQITYRYNAMKVRYFEACVKTSNVCQTVYAKLYVEMYAGQSVCQTVCQREPCRAFSPFCYSASNLVYIYDSICLRKWLKIKANC